jgi:signal transduction histidine kinase
MNPDTKGRIADRVPVEAPAMEVRDTPINILIVDDEPKNLTVLETVLENPGYRLIRATSADQALLALVADEFALLILDIRLPGMTGFELAQMIKGRKKTANVPIIFLTAYYNEDQHVLEGYGTGAVDYLHKPVNPAILRSKVAAFAELYRKNRALLAEAARRLRVEEQLRDLNATLEQRVAERTEELRENQGRLRHAADVARLTFFEVDLATGKARKAVNFAKVMGYAAPAEAVADVSAVSRLLLEHVVLSDRPRVESALQELIDGKSGSKLDYRVMGEDQVERWIESDWSLEFSEDGTPLKGFAINLEITSRKRTEDQLRRANLDLEQFAFSASHDLQEPLRNVAVYSQLFKKNYGANLDDKAKMFLEYMIDGAQRMGYLLSDLLKYTQAVSLDQGPVKATDAECVLAQVLENLRHTLEASNASITHSPLPSVCIDEVHLNQLFQNLIGNALKYRKDDRAPKVHISAMRLDGQWRFSVKDNGIGIAPEYQRHVFGIFKRLNAKTTKYSGTGVGLAICQKTVERYGGHIWIESELGEGSTFHFTIPGAGGVNE